MRRKRPADHVGQKTWGWLFQERRDLLGLSQKDIAEITGLTQQAISRFENDEVHPRAETLEKYAKAVGAKYEELFHPAFRPQGRSDGALRRQRERITARKKGGK